MGIDALRALCRAKPRAPRESTNPEAMIVRRIFRETMSRAIFRCDRSPWQLNQDLVPSPSGKRPSGEYL